MFVIFCVLVMIFFGFFVLCLFVKVCVIYVCWVFLKMEIRFVWDDLLGLIVNEECGVKI